MAAKTFKWKVERDVSPSVEFRVITAQFGDGYEQRSADGINTKNEQYGVKVNALTPVAKEIQDFFDELNGTKSFLWTPPLGKLGLFTCANPQFINLGGQLWSFSGTFTKVFASLSGVQ